MVSLDLYKVTSTFLYTVHDLFPSLKEPILVFAHSLHSTPLHLNSFFDEKQDKIPGQILFPGKHPLQLTSILYTCHTRLMLSADLTD